MSLIYLDNAATTPLDDAVLEAMLPYFKEHYGNPSSQYSIGRTARAAIEAARKLIAKHLNADGREIIFTSGGTEANNLALFNAVTNLDVKRIITSPIEHHCVLHTLEILSAKYGIELRFLEVDQKGKINLHQLEAELIEARESQMKVLVSIMHANNEIGTKNDLAEISKLAKSYDAFLHSDTVQTMAHFKIDAKALEIDFFTGSGHKFHGPKGSGFLFAKKGHKIRPILHGGGQERQKRAGTENVAGIVGLATAMDLAYQNLDQHRTHIKEVKQYFIDKISTHITGVTFNGETIEGECLYTVLSVSLPPCEQGSLLLFQLDMAGICASGGSACSSGAPTSSHVLSAIKHDPSRIAIRFSFSKHNTKEEVDKVVDVLTTYYPKS